MGNVVHIERAFKPAKVAGPLVLSKAHPMRMVHSLRVFGPSASTTDVDNVPIMRAIAHRSPLPESPGVAGQIETKRRIPGTTSLGGVERKSSWNTSMLAWEPVSHPKSVVDNEGN